MRFDDLLPIVNQRKISNAIIKLILKHLNIFLFQTGELMFKQINIPFIMMEWANIKTVKYRANLILEFFLNRHYIPYDSETCQPRNQTNYFLWNIQDIL
ncbi:unnamed protein product [Rotaria sp. Silwood2]|nr:unnamed protein product [Rotaria sp. Silwood2]CAF4722645.1 unnamed protein product [Rotaria sp. Silwood2]